LIDLGISKGIDTKTRENPKAGDGTLNYTSPEQLEGMLSTKIDIWQFGCIILQFVTGFRPFDKARSEFDLVKWKQ